MKSLHTVAIARWPLMVSNEQLTAVLAMTKITHYSKYPHLTQLTDADRVAQLN